MFGITLNVYAHNREK